MKQALTYLVIVSTNPFAILLQVKKKTLTFFAFCFEFFERFIPLFTSIVAHSKYQLHTRQ